MKKLPDNMKQCVKVIVSGECPSGYGLNDHCSCSEDDGSGCAFCWEQALDEIKDE